ncbi:uncharacterized protein LOC110850742 isoform X2 [Folsomia candida]|uniref:uncharacterized protein LOC110850742 isoform X2 n=1 Tax=Folsomia candida TaxID=158441 RepID=UPI0016050BA9|nr:uncharacterized protein LOC110850742 isoform X2 [Folsomia candida]
MQINMLPKIMRKEGNESDSFTDDDDNEGEISSSDNDTTPTKRARMSSSKSSNSSGYQSTPRRVTRSMKTGGGTSSAAANKELRGAFDDDDDDVTVGESTDDEVDELEDPDELVEKEVDLKDWKLGQIDDIFEKIKAKMDESKAGRKRMAFSTLRSFIDKYENVKQATEVLPEMRIKEYFVKLPPPTDNQEYNDAVANLEEQDKARGNRNVKLKCPLQPCPTTFATIWNAKTHVLAKHLKLMLFGCQKCPLRSWKDYPNMKHHVMSSHFDVKHKCPDCLMLVKKLFNLDLHAKLGHVTPTGKEIFFSPSQRKIDKKPFKPEYITAKFGCTYQLYVIPWVDKNGKLVDISICFTKFDDIKEVARQLWTDIVNACEKIVNEVENDEEHVSESWVEMCGSARAERAKGHEMRPDLAFPLEVYGVSLIVACQLKWFARLYYDCVKIMSTGESKYFFQKYNQELKDLFNAALTNVNMPQKNIDHVNLTGAQFNMPVDE